MNLCGESADVERFIDLERTTAIRLWARQIGVWVSDELIARRGEHRP